MKHICVITTGGTIDSFASGNSISVEERASGKLVQLLDDVVGTQADYEILSPLNKNSEDFSLHDIEEIAAAIDGKAGEGRRRFIVTHGTDSLHFTAAALGLLFSGRDIGICMVAAFRPLFQAGSDGPDNLAAAVAWLTSPAAGPSTCIALKEDISEKPVHICDWRDLKPLDFDSAGLESLKGRVVARYAPDSGLSTVPAERRLSPPAGLSWQGLGGQSRNVRLVHSYPGLNGEVLNDLAARARVVVIGAYHSGTLPSSDDPQRGITGYMAAHPETLFLLARHPDRAEGYASVARFEAAGGMVIRHLLPHQAYILACLLSADGRDVTDIRQAIEPFSRPGTG